MELSPAKIVAATGWTLAACATPTAYVPLGANGGYSESRTAENAFVVRFEGNADTPQERVEDFAFLRAAELAKASGFPFFDVAGADRKIMAGTHRWAPETKTTTRAIKRSVAGPTLVETTTVTTQKSTIVPKPVMAIVVVCYQTAPDSGRYYVAQEILDAVAEKYGMPHH